MSKRTWQKRCERRWIDLDYSELAGSIVEDRDVVENVGAREIAGFVDALADAGSGGSGPSKSRLPNREGIRV
jgi:hypothetical protein